MFPGFFWSGDYGSLAYAVNACDLFIVSVHTCMGFPFQGIENNLLFNQFGIPDRLDMNFVVGLDWKVGMIVSVVMMTALVLVHAII